MFWQKIKSAAKWLATKIVSGCRWLGVKLGVMTALETSKTEETESLLSVQTTTRVHEAIPQDKSKKAVPESKTGITESKTEITFNSPLTTSKMFGQACHPMITDPNRNHPVLTLPNDIFEMINPYLENKELLAFARTSSKAYQAFYLGLKAAMLKVLKKLVNNDDTVQVEKLLKINPDLQSREDKLDPEGRAYQGMEITPYQMTLIDPFLEETRTLLEESFPGKTKEEKLQYAALEAAELKRKPLFDQLRDQKHKIMAATKFAYETYLGRFRAWEAAGFNNADKQGVQDAWARVGLAQNQWSMRLRKLFSWVNMDENQTFENLPRDLPDPCFKIDPNDPWLPGTIKGCNLYLMSVREGVDLDEDDFRDNLRALAAGRPTLIRQGEGEEATYHLYAPYIPLDRDESEWRVIPINDPTLIQLIRWGRSSPDRLGNAVDFSREVFLYSPVFADLYSAGARPGCHLGSGSSYIFAAYSSAVAAYGSGALALTWHCCWDVRWAGARGAAANFAAVTALCQKRTERLAKHLDDLEHYLPEQKTPARQFLG